MRIKALEPVFQLLYRCIFLLCKLLLGAMVVVVSVSVLGRILFSSPPPWGEEGGLFCMIWLASLSAALAVRSDTHLRMMIIDMFIPENAQHILNVVIDICTFAFAVFLLIQGIRYTQLGTLSMLAGMRIKKAWLFACVPATGLAMIISLLDVYLVQGGRKGQKNDEC